MCVRLNRVRFCVKEHTRASNTNICFDTAAASSSFIRFFFIRMHVGMWMCTFMRHTVHTCKCVNGYINRTYDYIGVFWRLCKYSQWIDTILYYYTIAEATHRRPHATIRKRNKKSTFLTFPIPSALASTSCLSFIVPYDFNRFYSLVSLQSNSIRDPHAFAFGAPHLDTSVDLKTPSAISIWKCIHVCWLLSSYFDSHCCCCCFFCGGWILCVVSIWHVPNFFPCTIPLESLPMRQTFKYKDAFIFNAKIYAMPDERKRNYLFFQDFFLGLLFLWNLLWPQNKEIIQFLKLPY